LTLAKHNRKSASVFAKYVLDMSKVLNEISRVLKTDAHCVIVSGYNLISSIVVPTPEVIVELAEREGFQLMVCYADRIRDRWVPTIRNGHNGVIDQEYLLVFRKIR
jgi:ubiquinone/menaquinone biosynthesis C-methylase UbiE